MDKVNLADKLAPNTGDARDERTVRDLERI
jgi:hypothetical protein